MLTNKSETSAPLIAIAFSRSITLSYIVFGLLTLLSIHFFDRNIAEFMHHYSEPNLLFYSFSKIPLLLEILAAGIVLVSFHQRYQLRLVHIRKLIILVAVIASGVRVGAKVVFGRTWPETWTNDNLSWITHGVESFHPFSLSNSFHSFPSGHALLTFAFASLFWHFAPKYKLVWLFSMVAVMIGQVGQNYHYLGDVLAGALIGTLLSHLIINGYARYYQAQKKGS